MNDPINPHYEEIVRCDLPDNDGPLLIKVVVQPYLDPVEFTAAQATAFAQQILNTVARMQAIGRQ